MQSRPAEGGLDSAQFSAPSPLHRVRAAYTRTEAHLSAAGLPRRDSETPAEYLSRVASRWPEMAGPLAALSAAYDPVRYGDGINNAQAERSADEVLDVDRPSVS
ncbi:hypothetical protein GCM10017783_05000 [Deinococcus piscis]|uniref:Protein-glutamine gamma-glutamyltransferase-like C-terminal domain-containing protein n=1 Tax=Deinococcus piscis TaxID=394230 RepID=A0ABQ3JYP4_9DEIO|nr:DUF4129 domain-containing protein [Deinococcus piscis]GHF96135.1 hypothetical protein GCM10017783_05000 [Deinococcus piscis]